jgi:hypothetical protein
LLIILGRCYLHPSTNDLDFNYLLGAIEHHFRHHHFGSSYFLRAGRILPSSCRIELLCFPNMVQRQ